MWNVKWISLTGLALWVLVPNAEAGKITTTATVELAPLAAEETSIVKADDTNNIATLKQAKEGDTVTLMDTSGRLIEQKVTSKTEEIIETARIQQPSMPARVAAAKHDAVEAIAGSTKILEQKIAQIEFELLLGIGEAEAAMDRELSAQFEECRVSISPHPIEAQGTVMGYVDRVNRILENASVQRENAYFETAHQIAAWVVPEILGRSAQDELGGASRYKAERNLSAAKFISSIYLELLPSQNEATLEYQKDKIDWSWSPSKAKSKVQEALALRNRLSGHARQHFAERIQSVQNQADDLGRAYQTQLTIRLFGDALRSDEPQSQRCELYSPKTEFFEYPQTDKDRLTELYTQMMEAAYGESRNEAAAQMTSFGRSESNVLRTVVKDVNAPISTIERGLESIRSLGFIPQCEGGNEQLAICM